MRITYTPAKHLDSYWARANAPEALLIHRCAVGTNTSDTLRAFEGAWPEAAQVTNRKMPYTFCVEPDGDIVQCTPLGKVTPHARSWNQRGIGIAALGDFRRSTPPDVQWYATAVLVATLKAHYGFVSVMGHDEAPGSTSDASKQCPGALWHMPDFRLVVGAVDVHESDLANFRAKVVL